MKKCMCMSKGIIWFVNSGLSLWRWREIMGSCRRAQRNTIIDQKKQEKDRGGVVWALWWRYRKQELKMLRSVKMRSSHGLSTAVVSASLLHGHGDYLRLHQSNEHTIGLSEMVRGCIGLTSTKILAQRGCSSAYPHRNRSSTKEKIAETRIPRGNSETHSEWRCLVPCDIYNHVPTRLCACLVGGHGLRLVEPTARRVYDS